MAETLTKPAAPDADEESIEVSLPEGFLLDEEPDGEEAEKDESKATPEGDAEPKEPEKTPEPEAKAEPEKPASKTEPADDEPKAEPTKREKELLARANEDRAKRKEYAKLYAEATDRAEAAERRLQLLTNGPDPSTDPTLKKWHDELIADADNATQLSAPLKAAMKEMERRERALTRQLNAQLYSIRCETSELRARQRHPDWEEVIAKAGFFQAIETDAQGQFKDPVIGKRIYFNADNSLNADPGERMYRLALGKLEYERQQTGEPDEVAEEAPEAPKGKVVEKKAEPKVDAKEAERRGEQNGARRVIEQVSKNTDRLKGVRNLPKAGNNGTTRFSKAQLDRLMEQNPSAYEALVARNPELERMHLS